MSPPPAASEPASPRRGPDAHASSAEAPTTAEAASDDGQRQTKFSFYEASAGEAAREAPASDPRDESRPRRTSEAADGNDASGIGDAGRPRDARVARSAAVPLGEKPAEDAPSADEETADASRSWSFEDAGSEAVGGARAPRDAQGRGSEPAAASSRQGAQPWRRDLSLLTGTVLVSLLTRTVLDAAPAAEGVHEEEDVPHLDAARTASRDAEDGTRGPEASPSADPHVYRFYQPSASASPFGAPADDAAEAEDATDNPDPASDGSERHLRPAPEASEGAATLGSALEAKDEASERENVRSTERTREAPARAVSAEGAPAADAKGRTTTSTSVQALISLLGDIRTHEQKLHVCLDDIRALEQDLHESNRASAPAGTGGADDPERDAGVDAARRKGHTIVDRESESDKEPVPVPDSSLGRNVQDAGGATNERTTVANENEDDASQDALGGTVADARAVSSPAVTTTAKALLSQLVAAVCDDLIVCQPLGASDGGASLDGTADAGGGGGGPEGIECPAELHRRDGSEERDLVPGEEALPPRPSPEDLEEALRGAAPRAARLEASEAKTAERDEAVLQPRPGPEETDCTVHLAAPQVSHLGSFESRTAEDMARPVAGAAASALKAESPWAADLKSLESRTKGNLALLQLYQQRKGTEVSLLEKYMLS